MTDEEVPRLKIHGFNDIALVVRTRNLGKIKVAGPSVVTKGAECVADYASVFTANKDVHLEWCL
jgi:hypothetical protein